MSVVTIEQLYEQYVRPMSTVEQLRLVAMITQQLVREPVPTKTIEQHYEQHIKPMPAAEQLQLVTIITQQLATRVTEGRD